MAHTNPHHTTKCKNLISPASTRFCCFASFYRAAAYRVMLPKMLNSSKYERRLQIAITNKLRPA